MANKATRPDPKTIILEQMKSKVEAYCGGHDLDETDRAIVMADFREVVQEVLERWDGKAHLLFFVWAEGAHAMQLGDSRTNLPRVHADRRKAEVAVDMARGGQAFEVTLKAGLVEAPLRDVPELVRYHYADKTPLASLGC